MAGILTLCKGKITKKGSMMGFLSLEDLTGVIEGLVFPKIYEKYVHMLVPDSLVILDGKLSFREEEEPKLLVDSVRPLNAQNVAVRLPPAKAWGDHSDPAPRGGEPSGAGAATRGAAGMRPASRGNAAAQTLTDAQLAKQAARRLYLLIPSRAEMEGVKALCAAHAGDVPVTVKLSDEGIAFLLQRECWCDGGEELLTAFRERLGAQNVVLKGTDT